MTEKENVCFEVNEIMTTVRVSYIICIFKKAELQLKEFVK